MNNGIIGNLGASKRSLYGIAAMGAILKLSTIEDSLAAMILVTVLAIGYMILDDLKDRRHVKEH